MATQSSLNLKYEFTAPRRVVFGCGRSADLGTLVSDLGSRAFLLIGSKTLLDNGTIASVLENLNRARVDAILIDRIDHEPLVVDVDRAAGLIRGQGPRAGDVLVAIGGGSVIDLAKATAALIAHPQHELIVDFLEGVGIGAKVANETLPIVAVPTTAGTGAEATRNAVISSYDPPFKKSIRSEKLLPQLVVIDPELATSVPPSVTAATGMDAITQLIESGVSRRSTWTSQQFSMAGLEGVVPALKEAFHHGESLSARSVMAHAAYYSGLALANSGLGLAHGVAASLGVHARVPHGLACATLLPVAMKFNRTTRPDDFAQIGFLLTRRNWSTVAAAGEAAINEIESLLLELQIPRRLRDLGVTESQIPAIALDSKGNSLSGNPRDVTISELEDILRELY